MQTEERNRLLQAGEQISQYALQMETSYKKLRRLMNLIQQKLQTFPKRKAVGDWAEEMEFEFQIIPFHEMSGFFFLISKYIKVLEALTETPLNPSLPISWRDYDQALLIGNENKEENLSQPFNLDLQIAEEIKQCLNEIQKNYEAIRTIEKGLEIYLLSVSRLRKDQKFIRDLLVRLQYRDIDSFIKGGFKYLDCFITGVNDLPQLLESDSFMASIEKEIFTELNQRFERHLIDQSLFEQTDRLLTELVNTPLDKIEESKVKKVHTLLEKLVDEEPPLEVVPMQDKKLLNKFFPKVKKFLTL